MFMSSVPQGFVLGFTDGVTLGGDSTPVIDGICQPCMMGFSLHDPVSFSRSLGDRSGATQASQCLVIPCLDRRGGFREKGGCDRASDSRDR